MKNLKTLLLAAMMLVGATASAADDTKPWTFWYWMYGAVSRPGIHADLVAMQRAGLGGFYLMPIRSPKEKPELGGTITQLSPEFWQMADYALQQADSLGLGVGVHVSDGFALAGGPWITPEESMQQVVWSDTVVSNLSRVRLSQPPTREGYYRDIRCVAIPLKGNGELWAEPQSVGGTIHRNEKGIFFSKQAGTIDFTFAQAITLRAIEVTPQSANVQSQRMTVLASDDGTAWRKIYQMEPPRQGWQSNGHAFTYALPPTRAAHIRLQWTPEGTEPGSEELDQAKWNPTLKLERVRFLTVPRIGGYEGKNGSEWRISAATTEQEIPQTDCISPDDVVLMKTDGDAFSPASPLGKQPKGRRWLVLRIGHTSTGMTNATGGGAKGLECDKFSISVATKQFQNWYGRFLELPHANAISHFHIDSWECGTQNWGSDFAQEFQRRRGYDLMPWLPVMAGVPMETIGRSEQVLRDIRLTVSDLVRDRFYATTTRLAHEHGKIISHESIAPTFVADGMEHYRLSDVPMGEFWLNSPTHDKPNDMLDAVSGAHIYGKNIVQAEGFTEVRGVWDESPATLKALLDRNYCWGMNKMVLHVCAHNPWLDRRPGMTLDGIGLFFQRDNTWYPMADGLTGYMSRCQRWLQRGEPVADVAVFSGEEMPRRSLTPDKLVPMLPGLFGPERVASERKRLANEGCPTVESPVGVRHNANIFSLDGWNNPLHGYQYDTVNPDVLLSDNVSSPMSHYRIFVVPQGKRVSPSVTRRINQLRERGIVVVDSVYSASDFTSLGVPPDAVLPDGLAYTHRHDRGWGDIYFLSNQSGHELNATVKLRAKAPYATLYDPLADTYSTLKANADGSYTVGFAVNGSAFVLLTDEPIPETAQPVQPTQTLEIGSKWTVSYPETGISREATLPDDWTQSDDPRIKYYSGIATYSTTFRLKGKPTAKTRLRLPANSGMTYRVSVNGEDCGVAWTAPYTVDISGHLRRGLNTLSIEAANPWRNALLGVDLGTPPYPGIWTNAKYRRADNNPDPAGLPGPVVMEY